MKDSRQIIKTLTPFAKAMPGLRPGDWLSVNREPGQTFAQFFEMAKAPISENRKKIYVLSVGDFNSSQKKIEQNVEQFLGIFFNLPVEVVPAITLSDIPKQARRKNPVTGQEQILTRYVMEEKIFPILPQDTAAYLAFTAADLWTGEGSNFVFGEASGDDPVGIWSMARYGDPDQGKATYQKCLLRALKVATHETGHMFGLMHCTHYACGMNGYNSLAEGDRHPLAFCPECVVKLTWVTKTDLTDHCRRAAQFLLEHELNDEAKPYEDYLKALKK